MRLCDKSGTKSTCRQTIYIRLFVLWAFVLALVGLLSAGCTSSGISSNRVAALFREVQTRGGIVGLEGLQPFSGFSAYHLVGTVGDELGLAHSATSGNYMVHMPIIEQASKRGWPIYLVGYSLGGDQARLLAEACKERGITIRILFLLDPWWNPAVEAQATDRAHRIGQTRVVTSYKLICAGTVEEKVLQLQEAKRALLADVFEASAAAAANLSLDDLRTLLRP